MRKLALYGVALPLFVYSQFANAVTCTSVAAGGNWNATGTWTGCLGGNGTVANTPGSADTAVIQTTGASNVTVNVTVTVGALTINSSGSGGLVASSALTVNGATQLQAGTFNLSANVARTFVGLVTVSGGTWGGTTRAATFRGGLTVSGGTFTAGSGTHTFNTNSQALTGTFSLPRIVVSSPITLTNNGSLTSTTRITTNAGGTFTNAGTVTVATLTSNGVYNNNGTTTVSTSLAGTGSLVQGVSSTLNLNSATTITTLTATATDNTVNYTGAAQAVKTTTYYNLATSGSGNKTPGAGTLTINGNFTIGLGTTWVGSTSNPAVTFNPTVPALATFTRSGTYTSGTGLHTFSGTKPILIDATTITFSGSMTISNTDTVSGVTIRPTVTVTSTLTVGAGSIMTLGDGTTTTTPCPTAATRTFNATSTVDYNGTNGAQTVAAATYGNLILSGGGNKTPAAGTITVNGNFSIEASTTWLGSTNNPAVTFNPTVPTSVTFNNSGTFTSGTGLYTFSGTKPILISGTNPTFSGSMTISNTDAVSGVTIEPNVTVTGTLTVGAGSIMTLGDAIVATTPLPTAGVTTFNATSTVDYNGTNGSQTVAVDTYGNLTLSSGGTKTFAAGTHTIAGAFTIGTSTTFDGTTNNPVINLAGNFSNSGTYNAGTGLLTFNGAAQAITGSTTFGNLTLAGSGTKTPSAGTFSVTGNFTLSLGVTWAGNTNNPTVNFGGNFSNSGTFTSGTGLYTFNGTGTQLISGTAPTFSGSMTISNTEGTSGVTIEPAVTVTGTLTLSAGTIMTLGDGTVTTTALPTATTKSFSSTSTVRYNGTSGAQTVGVATYGNLTLSGGGVKTPAAGTITVAGDFTLAASTSWTGTTNNPTVNIAGDFSNAGAAFTSGTGVYTFNGTAAQTFTGATTFSNLTLNNTSAVATRTLTLSNDLTIATNLTFSGSGGRIITGANKVVLSGTGTTVTGGGTGWVVGNFQKNLLAAASPTFEVGTDGAAAPSLAYTPVSFVFTGGGAGTLAVSVTDSEHPQISTSGIDSSRNIDRYWAMSGTLTFTSYAATVTFVSGDVDAAAATGAFVIKKWSGAAWSGSTVGTRTATTTQATAISGALPNQLAVGQAGCIANSGAGNWNTSGTWKCGHVPLAGESVLIPNASTVTLDVNSAAVVGVTVESGGVLQGDGNATPKILNIDGTNNFEVWNDGTIDFSGIAGGGGSKAAVLKANTAAINITQTAANPSVWRFSTIDFNSLAATLSNITAIEMNGHATPFQNIAGGVTGALACTWTFSGTTAQAISSQLGTWSSGTTTFTITNTNATGVTVSAALTLSGNLNVNASSVLTLGGTTTAMPTVTGTKTFDPTSTVRFAGTGAQVVSAETYGNLYLGAGGVKTPAALTHNILGNFTLDTSTTYTGTTNNPVVNLAGNFTNSGTFTSGSGVYTFNGTALQTLTGATTFASLNINNTAALPDTILDLNNNVTVTSLLNITFGGIKTNTNKLIMSSGSSLTGASAGTGWIVGNLQKFIAAGASTPSFEVGTLGTVAPQLAYSPVNLSFTGVGVGGGNMIVTTSVGDHSQIATSGILNSKTVNRTWTLTTTGVIGTALPAFTSYDATFNYITADLDVGVSTANVHAEKWSGSAWSAPTISTRTATSAKANGITALGEFALGEPSPISATKAASTFSDPISASNPKAIPGAVKEFTTVISNPSAAMDTGTVVVSDIIDSNISLKVSDISGGGSGPVLFTQGATSSGMTYTFTSLSSGTDNIDFSNDNGATWTYTPTAGGDGCDNNVTNIRVRPQGIFSTGINVSPAPSFQLTYRACVK